MLGLGTAHFPGMYLRVDPSAAHALPGVDAVLTGEGVCALAGRFPVVVPTAPPSHPLALDRVRYVGEPVAIVVAVDRYRAEDALAAIAVEAEHDDPERQETTERREHGARPRRQPGPNRAEAHHITAPSSVHRPSSHASSSANAP